MQFVPEDIQASVITSVISPLGSGGVPLSGDNVPTFWQTTCSPQTILQVAKVEAHGVLAIFVGRLERESVSYREGFLKGAPGYVELEATMRGALWSVNKSDLIDPLIWTIEDPKLLLAKVCDDLVNRP